MAIPPRYGAPSPTPRPRSLGDACRELGLDDEGQRCPECPLQTLCESETRWLVCRGERPRYLELNSQNSR